ncbi:MAG: hypothetical protein WKF40_05280 [Thermoleophilaceae bacterium]
MIEDPEDDIVTGLNSGRRARWRPSTPRYRPSPGARHRHRLRRAGAAGGQTRGARGGHRRERAGPGLHPASARR